MRLLGASGTRLATTGSGARWAPFRTDQAGRRDYRRPTITWRMGNQTSESASYSKHNWKLQFTITDAHDRIRKSAASPHAIGAGKRIYLIRLL